MLRRGIFLNEGLNFNKQLKRGSSPYPQTKKLDRLLDPGPFHFSLIYKPLGATTFPLVTLPHILNQC
jgi:hypothetical protein